MGELYRDIEKMWWSDKKPGLPLRIASHIYRTVSCAHLHLRENRAATPDIPIISIGNITAGGSGKTPFVIWLCQQLKQAGFKPVVICRGDGGKSRQPQILGHDSDPRIVGDEAALLFDRCQTPVIAAHDRVRASRMAREYGNIIILDDGFQYRHLKRICDIVLVPSEGVGNGYLIPAGPLREPVETLGRADFIIRTGGSKKAQPLSDRREWRWHAVEGELVQLKGKPAEPPTSAMALTAIARPERLIQSLEKLGIKIETSKLFPDHHPFTTIDIEPLLQRSVPVIVTAKDAVKLKRIWPEDHQLWVLEQQAEAESGLSQAILGSLSKQGMTISD